MYERENKIIEPIKDLEDEVQYALLHPISAFLRRRNLDTYSSYHKEDVFMNILGNKLIGSEKRVLKPSRRGNKNILGPLCEKKKYHTSCFTGDKTQRGLHNLLAVKLSKMILLQHNIFVHNNRQQNENHYDDSQPSNRKHGNIFQSAELLLGMLKQE